jgi:hypothetical protein
MNAAPMDIDVPLVDTPMSVDDVAHPSTPLRVEAQAEEFGQPPNAPRKRLIGRSRLLQRERREGEHQTLKSFDNSNNDALSIYPDYYDGPVCASSIIALPYSQLICEQGHDRVLESLMADMDVERPQGGNRNYNHNPRKRRYNRGTQSCCIATRGLVP